MSVIGVLSSTGLLDFQVKAFHDGLGETRLCRGPQFSDCLLLG
jgi:hypothetical protein